MSMLHAGPNTAPALAAHLGGGGLPHQRLKHAPGLGQAHHLKLRLPLCRLAPWVPRCRRHIGRWACSLPRLLVRLLLRPLLHLLLSALPLCSRRLAQRRGRGADRRQTGGRRQRRRRRGGPGRPAAAVRLQRARPTLQVPQGGPLLGLLLAALLCPPRRQPLLVLMVPMQLRDGAQRARHGGRVAHPLIQRQQPAAGGGWVGVCVCVWGGRGGVGRCFKQAQ